MINAERVERSEREVSGRKKRCASTQMSYLISPSHLPFEISAAKRSLWSNGLLGKGEVLEDNFLVTVKCFGHIHDATHLLTLV